MTQDNNNKNDICQLINPFSHRLLLINNGLTMINNKSMGIILDLQLSDVSQITGIILTLGPSCFHCNSSNIEVRIGYDNSNPQNNAVCYYSRITRKQQNNTIYIVCYRCPIYGDRIYIRLFGDYTGLEMNEVSIYGSSVSSSCAKKPQCNKTGVTDAWHQWINKDIDLNHVFESLIYKYLYPWLSLAARKMHRLGDEGRVEPIKLYVEYPLISPLDIASVLGQHIYSISCRIRWNQRYLDAAGIWQLKSIFNSSDVEIINSPHDTPSPNRCEPILHQFRFIVNNSPRQSLPEYMDIFYHLDDAPKMPLSHLSHSDEQNKQYSQSESLLPYWLSRRSGFLGGIDYYTLNSTIPLLDIPPPTLAHCTTDKHIDIPWFYFTKWIHTPVDIYLKTLSVKQTQLKDCVSSCDTFYEWHTRYRQGAWRGSLSGAEPNIKLAGNWRYHQRVVLREQSIQYPDNLDIEITHCEVCTNETERAVTNALGPFISINPGHDYERYIYSLYSYQGLIDIDGGTWSSRFYQLLSQGAVVFKQQTVYKEWWTDLLIPGTHYIPLSYSMIDTASIVNLTLADEERSQLIALNGVKFAATYLRSESWLKYSQMFLRAYSALLIKPWQKHPHIDTDYLFKHAERIRQEHKKFE